MGVIASLVMGGSLLVPFRIGINVVGPKEVGAWALIQSVFIVSRLPEMGVGLNLTRALAAERKSGHAVDPQPYFSAAFVLTILPVFALGCLIFVTAPTFLAPYFRGVISASHVWILCLLALGVTLFSATSTILLSIIEGFGRLTHRQMMMIASNLVLMVVAYPLVTSLGVIGLALTYAVASLVLMIMAAYAMLPLCLGHRISTCSVRSVVRDLWVSNLQVSVMAFTRMTFEPLTKMVVGSSGNLAAVAYVDLALKLTTQTKVVIQSAVQPLLAFGARRYGDGHGAIINTFKRAQTLVTKTNLLLMSCQFLSVGAISYIGLGETSPVFMTIYIMLVIGNGINSLGVVGYYYDVSAGKMGEVVIIHVQMMVLNLIAGLAGGWLLGPEASVAAYAFSFAFGGIALFRIWRKASGTGWRKLFDTERWLIAFTCTSLLLSIFVFLGRWATGQDIMASLVGLVLASLFAGWFVLNNWRTFRGKTQ